jgi:hypothetical protein
MSSLIATEERVSAGKYVPVHKRSPGSTSLSTRQTPVSDASKRRESIVTGDQLRVLIRSPEIPAPVYSIAELLELSKSPLVQTSLTSEEKQGIDDVMAYIPQPRRQTKSRSPSPTKSNSFSSPTTKSKRTSSPTKKAKQSPPSESVSLPKADTPSTPPRHRSSKRRPAEATPNTNPGSGHQHHRRKHWGYASSLHYNEDNWRVHPSAAIAA